MRKIALMFIIAAVSLTACKEAFIKADDGMEYKIISKGNGELVKYGNFMQLNMTQYYQTGTEDSVLMDTRTSAQGPMFNLLDSVATPIAFYKILSQLKKGDSVVIRMLTDSAFKDSPQGMPAYFKKGHYFLTSMRLVNIFENRNQADSARAVEIANSQKMLDELAKEQIVKDDKILQDYFKKNNIKVQKAPKGTYVEIIKPGTGPLMDSEKVASVNYTGKTLAGVMFDSNTDPSKGHVEPLPLNLTDDPTLGSPVITGWTDGVTLLNEGAVAKFYIPSSLGYGTSGAGTDIKPNEVLVFDIEVLDVMDRAEAKIAAEIRTKKMQEMQKKFMDSLQKANPNLQPVP